MSKPDLISLQGEWFAAKLIEGVEGPLFSMGNTPDAKIGITSETSDHYTSKDGTRAKDAVLRKAVGVNGSMTAEEVNKENKNILFSGVTTNFESDTVSEVSLGTVTANQMIDLGKRNLSNVTFKSGDEPIPDSTYELDLIYGTVTFNTTPSGPVTWSGTAGAVERTSLANNLSNEYSLLFKGIDTFTGKHLSLKLWRVQFSPETEFALINEDFGSFDLEFECLASPLKGVDSKLGSFGIVEQFTVTS